MSAVEGIVRTDYDAVPRVLHGPGHTKGKAYHMYDEYTAAALAAGSTIKMGVSLPIGARIKNITVMAEDLGTTSGTIAVGDAGNAARYLSAYATGSATKTDMKGANGVQTGWMYTITGTNDTDILITTAGAAITGKIQIDVEYYKL